MIRLQIIYKYDQVQVLVIKPGLTRLILNDEFNFFFFPSSSSYKKIMSLGWSHVWAIFHEKGKYQARLSIIWSNRDHGTSEIVWTERTRPAAFFYYYYC